MGRGSWYSEYDPSGFHVVVEFTASLEERIAGKREFFTVTSGLDPLQSRYGKKKFSPGFKSQDTLGGVTGRGASEWWHGDQETIESNKRKYLKRQKEDERRK